MSSTLHPDLVGTDFSLMCPAVTGFVLGFLGGVLERCEMLGSHGQVQQCAASHFQDPKA